MQPSVFSYNNPVSIPYNDEIVKGILSVSALIALAFTGTAGGAEEPRLFLEDSVIKAVLTAPIAQTYAQSQQDVRIYFPGQWSYINGDGETSRLDVSRP